MLIQVNNSNANVTVVIKEAGEISICCLGALSTYTMIYGQADY